MTALDTVPTQHENPGLEMNPFKNTAIELKKIQNNEKSNKAVIQKGIDALDLLVNIVGQIPRLKEMGMGIENQEYIEAALLRIYPEAGKMQASEIQGLLEEEKDILTKIRDDQPIESEELEQVLTFCSDMWYKLRIAEKGLPLHSR